MNPKNIFILNFWDFKHTKETPHTKATLTRRQYDADTLGGALHELRKEVGIIYLDSYSVKYAFPVDFS